MNSEMKLEINRFHPLDHYPWQQRCWGTRFHGGPAHHLRLLWVYKWREQLSLALRRR